MKFLIIDTLISKTYHATTLFALSPAEVRLKLLLQFWMISFALVGASFLFIPLLEMLNFLSLHYTPFLTPLSLPTHRFWLALTLSLMTTLVYLCYLGQKDIKQYIWVVPVILVSKFASTLFYALFFVFDTHSFAYFFGAIVDGSVFLVTYIFYKSFQKSNAHRT